MAGPGGAERASSPARLAPRWLHCGMSAPSAAPPSSPPSSPPVAPQRSRRVLELIAAFKFVKAATLVAAGLGALGMLDPRVERWTAAWLERLALGHGPRLLHGLAARAVPALDAAGPRRLVVVAAAAFVYAAVFVVEGVGLFRARRWAEYLTVVVTISFLPFEAVALAHRMSVPRAATLALNVAVVIYLIWRLRTDRAGSEVGQDAQDERDGRALAS